MPYYPNTSISFEYGDKHPYVNYQGVKSKVPITDDLRMLDILVFTGKKDYMVKISDDESHFYLSNVVDGGTF